MYTPFVIAPQVRVSAIDEGLDFSMKIPLSFAKLREDISDHLEVRVKTIWGRNNNGQIVEVSETNFSEVVIRNALLTVRVYETKNTCTKIRWHQL